MNYDFDNSFTTLIGEEGGYSNDPQDPGGETKYGISKRSYPNLDIANLSLDDAKAIYKRDYWDAAGCDVLCSPLNFEVFDMVVNSGLAAASKTLQKALGVVPDGHIGPGTRQAIADAGMIKLCVLFCAERLNFMADCSAWDHDGRGWAKRIVGDLKLIF